MTVGVARGRQAVSIARRIFLGRPPVREVVLSPILQITVVVGALTAKSARVPGR